MLDLNLNFDHPRPRASLPHGPRHPIRNIPIPSTDLSRLVNPLWAYVLSLAPFPYSPDSHSASLISHLASTPNVEQNYLSLLSIAQDLLHPFTLNLDC